MAEPHVDPTTNLPEKTPPESGAGHFALEGYAGPLPHPRLLEGYERVYPGAAKLIIDSFIEEGQQRRGIESQAIKAAIKHEERVDRRADRGQILALITTFGVLGAALGLAALGAPEAGAWVAGTTVVGLAVVFVTGRWSRSKDRPLHDHT